MCIPEWGYPCPNSNSLPFLPFEQTFSLSFSGIGREEDQNLKNSNCSHHTHTLSVSPSLSKRILSPTANLFLFSSFNSSHFCILIHPSFFLPFSYLVTFLPHAFSPSLLHIPIAAFSCLTFDKKACEERERSSNIQIYL